MPQKKMTVGDAPKENDSGGMPQTKNSKGGMPQYDDSQRSRNGLSSEKDVQNRRCTQRRGYTPVWHATANLNPLEMAERDSMSLERRSAESSYR